MAERDSDNESAERPACPATRPSLLSPSSLENGAPLLLDLPSALRKSCANRGGAFEDHKQQHGEGRDSCATPHCTFIEAERRREGDKSFMSRLFSGGTAAVPRGFADSDAVLSVAQLASPRLGRFLNRAKPHREPCLP